MTRQLDYLPLESRILTETLTGNVQYGGAGFYYALWGAGLPPQEVITAKLQIAQEIIYCSIILFIKVSMLCLYLRVFIEPWQRKLCYILIVVSIVFAIGSFVLILTQCVPLYLVWDWSTHDGQCFDRNAFRTFAASVPNLISDVILLLLPIPALRKIQLFWKDKIGLILTFLAGSR